MSRQQAFWRILLFGVPALAGIGFLGGMLMAAASAMGF